jgi:hypothetical protein
VTDLVERIETTRYLGAEFLVWLWFKSEVFQGEWLRQDESALELWLDSQMVMQSTSDKNERTVLRGLAPSASPEAKLALVRGKVPLKARVCITHDNQEFSFLFDAPSFSLGSLKVPAVLVDEEDQQFYERMQLVEHVEDLWHELYSEFLALRLSSHWDGEVLPAFEDWAVGGEGMTARKYLALVAKVQK